MSHNPYQTPSGQQPFPKPGPYPKFESPPAVLIWQRVYCVAMTFLYVACVAAGIMLYLNAEAIADTDPSSNPEELQFMGTVIAVICAPMILLFLVGIFWIKGQGAWIFHIVLISLGLTSACCWLTNIPLIIFWIKAKDYVVASAD